MDDRFDLPFEFGAQGDNVTSITLGDDGFLQFVGGFS